MRANIGSIKKFGAQLNYVKLFTFTLKQERRAKALQMDDIMGLFNFLSHCRHPTTVCSFLCAYLKQMTISCKIVKCNDGSVN